MFLLALLLQTAQPTPPPVHGGPQEMTCPVGGERFSAWQPMMYSTYGARPDGKPYSYLPFPFPLPECPGNKLVLFDEFETNDITLLTRIILMPKYQRLVRTETSYYRAYQLATALGRPKSQALGLLLNAIWQVSPDETSGTAKAKADDRLARYQTELIGAVKELDSTVVGTDRVGLLARAANAARQMQHFGDAERLREQAETSLANLADKGGWGQYLSKLHAVIARKDASIEPLDMIPEQQAALICARRPPSNSFDQSICDAPNLKTLIAKFAK
jgi:hypothetical protein